MENTIFVFKTGLGWMGLTTTEKAVKSLTFGHHDRQGCLAAAIQNAQAWTQGVRIETPQRSKQPWTRLIERLKGYAGGEKNDFTDVPVDYTGFSDFQRRVLIQCRNIRYGSTINYAALAEKAGHPNAARAVGNCMAKNQVPLIVPCHRVVRAGGTIGAYSSPGGQATKRRLLGMESGRSLF
jgi:methylated-DNA-[protein]-cysteine S-methyltransferase